MEAVTVFGAGVVGSHVAAHLARAGVKVNLIARGKNLAAIRENGAQSFHTCTFTLSQQILRPLTGTAVVIAGLRVISSIGDSFTARPRPIEDPMALPPQKLVFLAVKTYQQQETVDALKHLLNRDDCAKALHCFSQLLFIF